MVFILAGIPWGPLGVAMAQALTPVTLLIPILYYSFAVSPVTLRLFFRAVRSPLIASGVMALGLVALRAATPELDAVASLGVGSVVGGVIYCAYYGLESGSRHEIRRLLGDVGVFPHRTAPVSE
jgi:hypothetical protein